MAVEVYLPKMSDHMETGRIVKWNFKEGQRVEQGQIILELETDKAVGEVEAPAPGFLSDVRYGEGEVVPVGETIALIAESSGAVRATPLARKVAREAGVELTRIKGTGPRGIIRDEDVRSYLAQILSEPGPVAVPASLPAQPGNIPAIQPASVLNLSGATTGKAIPLNTIQKIAAQRMVESFQSAPHFYLQVAADMTHGLELLEQVGERILQETGEKVSVTVVLVKVAAIALTRFPQVNSMFEEDHLRLCEQVNIGVAIGTEEGLVVPVIKNADLKSLAEITREIKVFQVKAKDMRFSPDELSGGTFTISNLGMFGIDVFHAIINPPQSAILAVGRIARTPTGMPDDTITLRPMMNLALSVDHRALDGLQAAKFLAELKTLIETPYLIL